MTPLAVAELSREALLEKKASDITILDVRRISGVTDFFVVATGATAPQLNAMAEEVLHRLKAAGQPAYRRAGDPEGGWLVLDYIDVVIHMFSPEAREYYSVEALWADARRVE